MRTMSEAPILSDRLEQLLGSETAVIKEIADNFRAVAPQDMDRLQAALEAGDNAQVVQWAHKAKGAASNVGGERLREIAWQMESGARDGNLDVCRGLLPGLRSAFAQVVAAMLARGWFTP